MLNTIKHERNKLKSQKDTTIHLFKQLKFKIWIIPNFGKDVDN